MKTMFDLESTARELLEWVYDHSAGNDFMSVNAFTATKDLPYNAAYTLAEHLKSQGLVTAAIAGGGRADASLTPAGAHYVQQLRRRREDPVLRMAALRDQMLRWLFARERQDVRVSDWTDFLAAGDANFYGSRFQKAEVEHEVSYLISKNLITMSVHIDQEVDGWLQPQLTADGNDCITEHGGSVSDHVRSRNSGATYHFADNSGAISVNSSNVTQTVSHGVDTTALTKFAEAAAQMLPVLDGIPEDERDELQECAASVQAEVAKAEPNVGKLRELFNVLYLGVMKASSTVATDMLVGLGHDASKALGIGT